MLNLKNVSRVVWIGVGITFIVATGYSVKVSHKITKSFYNLEKD